MKKIVFLFCLLAVAGFAQAYTSYEKNSLIHSVERSQKSVDEAFEVAKFHGFWLSAASAYIGWSLLTDNPNNVRRYLRTCGLSSLIAGYNAIKLIGDLIDLRKASGELRLYAELLNREYRRD